MGQQANEALFLAIAALCMLICVVLCFAVFPVSDAADGLAWDHPVTPPIRILEIYLPLIMRGWAG